MEWWNEPEWPQDLKARAKSLVILKDSCHVLGMSCIWSEAFWRVVHKGQVKQFSSLTLHQFEAEGEIEANYFRFQSSVVCFGGLGMILYDRNERAECIMFQANDIYFPDRTNAQSGNSPSTFPVWSDSLDQNEGRTLIPAVTFLCEFGPPIHSSAPEFVHLNLDIRMPIGFSYSWCENLDSCIYLRV